MGQSETSMHPHDIALTFMLTGFIRKNPDNKFVLAIDWTKVEGHMAKVNSSLAGGTRINLDPDALRWTPLTSGGAIYGSPFKSRNLTETSGSPMKNSNGQKRKKKKQRSRDDESSSSSSSSSDDSDSNSDSDSDKNNDKKKLGKRDTKQKSLTGNGSGGLKRKTGSNSNTSGGGTGSGSNQNRNQNAKNSKNQKPNSGESKGLAGGTITNINTNLKTIRTGALSKVAQVLTFDDILNEEPKTKTINATSCGIPGSEKQPKRGQTIKKSDFSKNSSMKNSDKSGGFLTNQANNTSDTSSKKINHTYRSTILGQAIGKLLENKSKSNISVQKMEKSKKSSPNKSEQDLGNNKNKKLVKSKSSNFDSDVDADVEDELSESDLAVISKPKLVRKSASLSLTSPEKGLLKSSHSDLKSGIETNVNRSYRRAAASKASDRINRESRGRLSLSSSSSDDSRISDLDEDPNLVINNSKSRSSPGELPGRSLKNNSRTIGSGTKNLSITEKIKSTNKKKDLSSDADSDFKSAKTARMATTPTVLPNTSKKERPGHGSTPTVATPGSGPKPEVGPNRKWTPKLLGMVQLLSFCYLCMS